MEDLKPPQQPESIDFRQQDAENPKPTNSGEVFEPLEDLKGQKQPITNVPQDQARAIQDQKTADMVPASVDIEAASKKTPEEIINVKVGSAGIIDGSEVEKLIGPKGEL